jgi:hypothetical protein
MSGRLVILDPTAEAAPGAVEMASRLDSLHGKTIGLLDNTKLNSDRFLAYLQEALRARFPTAEFIVRRKQNASSVAAPALLDELAAKCDAVVAAVGD